MVTENGMKELDTSVGVLKCRMTSRRRQWAVSEGIVDPDHVCIYGAVMVDTQLWQELH